MTGSDPEQQGFRDLVKVAILLGIAIIVMTEVLDILPDSGAFVSAAGQVETLIGTAFELAPIILVVIVAAMVLHAIRNF